MTSRVFREDSLFGGVACAQCGEKRLGLEVISATLAFDEVFGVDDTPLDEIGTAGSKINLPIGIYVSLPKS